MAYAVKYRVDYKDHSDVAKRIDIELDNYVGDIIPCRAVAGAACVLSYDGLQDDKYEPIVSSSLNSTLYNEGQIDVEELQQAGDKTFRVVYYIEGVLKWQGYLIADGIEQRFAAVPYEVNISATDGLMLLDGIDLSLQNMPVGTGIARRAPLNTIREILFREQNLGTMLPIRWVSEVENTNFPGQDALWGSVEWSPEGEGYETFQGVRRSCLWVLENILKSFQCRIYLNDGRWNIERINDIATGNYRYREMEATTGVPLITTSTFDANKTIQRGGDYAFINEDHLITIKPGTRKVRTTYKVDIGENIIPNGGFEYSSLGLPMYWRLRDPGSWAMLSQALPLRDNSSKDPTLPDQSLKVDASLETSLTQVDLIDGYGQLVGMPIDTKFFPRMTLSFLFSVEEGEISPEGHIDAFFITVTFTNNNNTYYLTENGYWSTAIHQLDFQVTGYQLGDVANIDFRVKNQTGMINFPVLQSGSQAKELEPSDTSELKVTLNVAQGAIVYFDDFRVGVDTNNDVWEADMTTSAYSQVDERELEISSSYNGFMTTSYRSSWGRNNEEFHFTDGLFTGPLTALNSNAILRNNYLPSKIFNGSIYGDGWKYSDIFTIQTIDGKKFQQTSAEHNTETNITRVIAIETRNDAIVPAMRHYGTNDDIFSNFGSA